MARRSIFFISDGTAITAETLGHSLLTQFNHIQFDYYTIPFVDTVEKAKITVVRINQEADRTQSTPIVFSTLISPEIREIIKQSKAKVYDLFDVFISPLEQEFSEKSSQVVGKFHSLLNLDNYDVRIDAVNFALNTDDGKSTRDYNRADIVIIGVSRAGKTPTCLYLGLQFGIYAANFPLTEDDLLKPGRGLPKVLIPFRRKLFGLTIHPERLHKIREQRRPGSRYASLLQCQAEVRAAESLFLAEKIPFLNITTMSVEEIAAKITLEASLERRIF
ncbi:MAG: kinase/pyrophosphorylase [Syntrophales bacterium]|nr:kinase/pyrophosphorylase [Syntrophales bacterium]